MVSGHNVPTLHEAMRRACNAVRNAGDDSSTGRVPGRTTPGEKRFAFEPLIGSRPSAPTRRGYDRWQVPILAEPTIVGNFRMHRSIVQLPSNPRRPDLLTVSSRRP